MACTSMCSLTLATIPPSGAQSLSIVAAICEILGLDPLYVANEGKVVAVVPAAEAAALVATMREHPHGRRAAVIGEVIAEPRRVVVRTAVGGRRILDMPLADQLPRIC